MDKNEIFEQLRSLEIELASNSTRKNCSRVASLLADDFEEVGKSGRLFDKQSIIDSMLEETVQSIEFSNFRFVQLSEGVVLIKYLSFNQGVKASRSSIWVCGDGRWQMKYHQGTVAP